MIEKNIPEDQSKTIEVLLNKKAPKRHSSEKRKLVFITTGVLLAIAAPVTVAAVLVTKAHTENSTTQQKFDDLLKMHSRDIKDIMDKITANRDEFSMLTQLRNQLLSINGKIADQLINDSIVVAGSTIVSRIKELENQFKLLDLERKQAQSTFLAATNPSQVIETIYTY